MFDYPFLAYYINWVGKKVRAVFQHNEIFYFFIIWIYRTNRNSYRQSQDRQSDLYYNASLRNEHHSSQSDWLDADSYWKPDVEKPHELLSQPNINSNAY